MKNIIKVVLLLASFFVIVCLCGCSMIREKNYYADINNYITGEAVVDNIIYNEEKVHIVFWLSETDDLYQCGDFIIEGEIVPILLEKEILDKINIGDRIIFTSAPRYFGNGDFMPIVELVVNGEEIMSFKDGYENLMDLY